MRPEWHRCGTCYFGLLGNDEGYFCHYDPYPLETVENSFCSRWICRICLGMWDDEDDHSNCITVTVEFS